MNKMRLTTLLALVFIFNSMIQAEDNRDVNLSWIGFLNLPKQIQKEDKKIKVKKPLLWQDWSENKDFKVGWFAKPKQEHDESIRLYYLLDQSKTEDKSKRNRRWRHLNR